MGELGTRIDSTEHNISSAVNEEVGAPTPCPQTVTDLVSGTRKGHQEGAIAKLMRRQAEVCQGKGGRAGTGAWGWEEIGGSEGLRHFPHGWIVE